MTNVIVYSSRALLTGIAVLVFGAGAALADAKPGPNHIVHEAAVKAVTDAGYTNPHDVDFDNDTPNGEWEIEAFKDGKKYDVEVDATTGKITKEKLDD